MASLPHVRYARTKFKALRREGPMRSRVFAAHCRPDSPAPQRIKQLAFPVLGRINIRKGIWKKLFLVHLYLPPFNNRFTQLLLKSRDIKYIAEMNRWCFSTPGDMGRYKEWNYRHAFSQ